MRTATALSMTESAKGPLGRELLADKMISDAVLNVMIAASTPRVRVRALAFPVRSKYPAGKAAPVWGIWKANKFYFETDPNSAKGRNLSNNQSIVVHVQDGSDTVILEGSARGEKKAEKLNHLKKDYLKK